jgi:hypothetical protein
MSASKLSVILKYFLAEINLWYAALNNWNMKHNRPGLTTPFQTCSGYGRLVRTVLGLLEELIRVSKQARVDDTLTADDSMAEEDVDKANSHFPAHLLETLSAIATDIKAEEWRRLQRGRPGVTSGLIAGDLEKIAGKKRKVTSDIVTKFGESLGTADRQQLQTRLLAEAEAEDVPPMDWLNRLVCSAEWADINRDFGDKSFVYVPNLITA